VTLLKEYHGGYLSQAGRKCATMEVLENGKREKVNNALSLFQSSL
jgi:hypothetical protein